jgi:intergrase/recombinase
MDFKDVLQAKETQLNESLNKLHDAIEMKIQQEKSKSKQSNENFIEIKKDLGVILENFEKIINNFSEK